jgi:hypothetical protein
MEFKTFIRIIVLLSLILGTAKLLQVLGVDMDKYMMYISFIVFLILSTLILPLSDLTLN